MPQPGANPIARPAHGHLGIRVRPPRRPGLAPIPGYEWGAGHAAELAYLFPGFDNGTPIAPTFDADEQRLAEEMKLSWTAFTSSGDPRAAGLPDWPRYEAGGSALAWRAGGRSEVITDPQLAAGHQCDFWDPLPRQGWTVRNPSV